MTIEDLMNAKVTVSSKYEESIRESPNVISVISKDDIKKNHCRDLIDVFNMVPGMIITKDEDHSALSSRGLYGYEGRTLFMIDGLQLSELYFGTFPIGNAIPVHMIERIEIIRGPGSVTYGGTAELSVINIITKKEKISKKARPRSAMAVSQLPWDIGMFQ